MNQKYLSLPLLLILALSVDLLTPLLIWKGVIPAETRWISHAAIAAMIPVVYVQMMLVSGVPRPVFFVLFVSSVGGIVALLTGQSFLATAWGWWVMFQFPLVGLYAYLRPQWPDRLADTLCSFCVAVLALQVLVQIVQYRTGETPGDQLAGLFGEYGTGRLVVFLLFVYCLALGRWLASDNWRTAALVLLLGGLSSALGEMKLFPPAAAALSIVALVVFSIQRGRITKLVPFAAVSAVGILVCIVTYDRVVVPDRSSGTSILGYLDNETRGHYLDGAWRTEGGEYYMGRNYALAHGWNTIRKDSVTLLFGFGIGARSESRSLGTTGVGLEEERGFFATGTGLLVLLHEMGLMGISVLAGSCAWIILAIVKGIRRNPESDILQLRYAVLLFSLFWPLWFWYNHVLTLRVPMLLYWATLGIVLSDSINVSRDRPTDRVGGFHTADPDTFGNLVSRKTSGK